MQLATSQFTEHTFRLNDIALLHARELLGWKRLDLNSSGVTLNYCLSLTRCSKNLWIRAQERGHSLGALIQSAIKQQTTKPKSSKWANSGKASWIARRSASRKPVQRCGRPSC